jgi:heptosyltransferase-3
MIKGYEKLLILSIRNFGDAVIITSLIESLAKSFPNVTIDVITRPWFKEIFQNNPNINNVRYAQFPLWRSKNPKPYQLVEMLQKTYELRKHSYDICINNVGDFRENFVGKLIKPKKNISVIWGNGHPLKNIIKYNRLFNQVNEAISIPNDIINYYDVNHFIIKQIGGDCCLPPKIYLNDKTLRRDDIIAIHPMASDECRLWDFTKWSFLIEELTVKGYIVWVFCSPQEKERLSNNLKKVLDHQGVRLFAEPMGDFMQRLSQASLLIGLDSFSIHMAYAVNVPSIMLNGSNNYQIFAPKNAFVIQKNGACDYYPCYNKPKCLSKNRFQCMEKIEPEDILTIINHENI